MITKWFRFQCGPESAFLLRLKFDDDNTFDEFIKRNSHMKDYLVA